MGGTEEIIRVAAVIYEQERKRRRRRRRRASGGTRDTGSGEGTKLLKCRIDTRIDSVKKLKRMQPRV